MLKHITAFVCLFTNTVEPLLSGHLGFKSDLPVSQYAFKIVLPAELPIQKQLSNLLVGILYLTTRYIAAAVTWES